MEIFSSPFGELQLARWPLRKHDALRAWDAADELLLQHVSEQQVLERFNVDTPRVLLVNDAFGALTCALRAVQPVNWSDSYVSHWSAQENDRLNVDATDPNTGSDQRVVVDVSADGGLVDKKGPAWQRLASTQGPEGVFDVVLIKIPKTTALLEDQLIRLRAHLHKDSVVMAAGMVKHLQKSAFQCIEKVLGPLTTSLAKKKARLIFVTLDESLPPLESPYPSQYEEPDIGLTLSNHANVFSREHLDLGARFFLTQFSEMPDVARVIDLACGNGVLGIKYQQQHPEAHVHFVDESYMAVASASENYRAEFPDNHTASFTAGDGLSQQSSDSADLILCNPPFHQQHVIGEQIALGMFRDSKRCLAKGGELWVVANRHLPYASKLKQLFGNCRTVASNKKFVVLRVAKR